MSTTKTIEKNILISAPKEKVWEILFTDAPYRIWAAEFSPGSHFETDWKQGSKALFMGSEGGGLTSHISEVLPNQFLAIEFDGFVGTDGTEDLESENAKMYKGIRETYTLVEIDGVTELDISAGSPEEYFDMMDTSWDKALVVIKNLAEQK